ncbi:NADH-quinone oxidoreductase subunit C [Desulfacinum hydrothermale DSM 13146]|uniref:NADH-quinone oxidoreductase subunit C n=1 Tax=Desulfacinum hydrothermale DSM 13146 TaxID=1121390 RepID=A0A1W1X911_9BACT|nr:NADH-quinone oxidoreductase subunit C [Desulfacinum hydrothermale]SMC20353.1 NADH-quinone oxidoreductase subunit C [Desulfacinum hydrothermale DSM 13146]
MSRPEESRLWMEQVLEDLSSHGVLEKGVFRDQWWVAVPRDRLREVMEALRDRWGFRYLSDVTAVDRLPKEPRFQLVYHVWCHEQSALLRVKTWAAGDPPAVPSLTPLWSAADWLEREVYDLFGIHFQGHPDLRRILLPPDWEGHPLRKDYPTEGPDWDLD